MSLLSTRSSSSLPAMKRSLDVSSVERHEQAFFARQFILAATGVVYWLVSRTTGFSSLPYLPIALAVLLNVFYYALASRRIFYPQVKWVQIPVDLALWTWLIHLTGGPWSTFYPLYAFEIMLSAVALSVAGCAYASLLSIVFYTLECYMWPGAFVTTSVIPKLVLFAGTGAVCALLIRKLTVNERIVRLLNERLRRVVNVTLEEENAILENMTSGLVGVDSEGRVTMFNRKAEEITGLRGAEILGKRCSDVLGAESPVCSKALAPLRGTTPPEETEVEVDFNGHRRYISLSCFALPDGFPTRSVCVFQDKTEVRQLEQRAIRVETLSALGAMAATLAHELRTPLTAIGGFASVLRNRLDGSTREAEIAHKIERGVTSLETVTGQLLSFTETPELSKARVRLAKVIESTVELLPEKMRGCVKLSVKGDETDLTVKADPLQLRQALLNLILNACQAAGESGEVNVALRRSGEEAHVEIADTGPGVPDELQARIFLPFFTTKKGGTGLGLAHSDKLVRAHGGRITLDGSEAGGAAFTVKLPWVDPVRQRAPLVKESQVGATMEVL